MPLGHGELVSNITHTLLITINVGKLGALLGASRFLRYSIFPRDMKWEFHLHIVKLVLTEK